MLTEKNNRNISIAIITHNEEGNIGACIQSVKKLGLIVVVDSGSTDQTAKNISTTDAKLLFKPWINFSIQKQYAVDNCPTDWVLILDADERLTAQLIEEIKNLVLNDPSIAYAIPRRSFFLGDEVKYCGWRPDYVIRLFNRNYCKFNGREVHETIIGFKKVQYLKNSLVHYSYQSEADIDKKVSLYSDLGAQAISTKRTKIPPFEPVLRATWIFLKTFLLRLGFLDRLTGFRVSMMNYESTYLKYKKAQQLLNPTKEH